MTEAEWLKCDDPRAMLLEVAGREVGGLYDPSTRKVSDRKLRLFACSCVRLASLLGNRHSCKAVEVAERLCDGKATTEEVNRTWLFGTEVAFTGAAIVFESVLATNAYAGARRIQNTNRVQPAEQTSLLRDLVGNPYRPTRLPKSRNLSVEWDASRGESVRFVGQGDDERVEVTPPWLTPTVLSLARAAYDHRQDNGTLDSVTLLALADALEEAGLTANGCIHCGYGAYINLNPPCGCASQELLLHLRFCGPHVRGCWAVDLLLGKS